MKTVVATLLALAAGAAIACPGDKGAPQAQKPTSAKEAQAPKAEKAVVAERVQPAAAQTQVAQQQPAKVVR